MKTYQGRMKTYCFTMIILLLGLLLLAPLMGHAAMSTDDIDVMNKRMAKTLEPANALSLEHWGTKTIHSMILSSSGKVISIDYARKALDVSCQPVQKQIDFQVDQFRLQLGKEFEKRGIEKVRVLIDGIHHSTYRLY